MNETAPKTELRPSNKKQEIVLLIQAHYTLIEEKRSQNPTVEINGILYPDRVEWIGDKSTWDTREADRTMYDHDMLDQVNTQGGVFFHSHPVSESTYLQSTPSTMDIRSAALTGVEVIFHQLGITFLFTKESKNVAEADSLLRQLWQDVQGGGEYALEREYDDPAWVMHSAMIQKFEITEVKLIADPNGKVVEVDQFITHRAAEATVIKGIKDLLLGWVRKSFTKII